MGSPQRSYRGVGSNMLKRVGFLFFLGSCAFAGGAIGLVVLPRMTPKVFAEAPAAIPSAGAEGQLLRLSERFEAAALKVACGRQHQPSSRPRLESRALMEESGSA